MLILAGYFRSQFAQDHPLTLSASVAFEQSYAGVDGDSASSTELYGLVSALSEIPLRQDIAVTGSVNQKGEVQAIGGVNQKAEGFYDVCRLEGLTGNQGVMIPASNVDDLMLRKDLIQAVADGKFHIYAIDNIKDGIEILTGVAAGERNEEGKFPEDSVFGKVEARLQEMARSVKEFGKKKDEEGEEGEEGEKSEEEKEESSQ
jgi:Lon-like ATP-dependent protease